MIIDLFAGIGGWELAGESLDLELIGYENWKPALGTREAHGWPTVAGDVREQEIPEGITGLVASPPCQTFSMAGSLNGWSGKRELSQLIESIERVVDGRITLEQVQVSDDRTRLSIEPIVWASIAEPAWMALEQVPPVLPLWEAYADLLHSWGYSTWTGVLDSEAYGVAQARQRAILIASRERAVRQPPPSHSRYHRRRKQPTDPHLPRYRVLADEVDTPQEWATWRPAPTVCGTHRPELLSPPVYRSTQSRLDEEQKRQSVVITLADALALQGFPRDYYLDGSTGLKWRQVANAIPVPLAKAVIREAAGL